MVSKRVTEQKMTGRKGQKQGRMSRQGVDHDMYINVSSTDGERGGSDGSHCPAAVWKANGNVAWPNSSTPICILHGLRGKAWYETARLAPNRPKLRKRSSAERIKRLSRKYPCNCPVVHRDRHQWLPSASKASIKPLIAIIAIIVWSISSHCTVLKTHNERDALRFPGALGDLAKPSTIISRVFAYSPDLSCGHQFI